MGDGSAGGLYLEIGLTSPTSHCDSDQRSGADFRVRIPFEPTSEHGRLHVREVLVTGADVCED